MQVYVVPVMDRPSEVWVELAWLTYKTRRVRTVLADMSMKYIGLYKAELQLSDRHSIQHNSKHLAQWQWVY